MPNYDWWQEFSAQATGLGTTFVPSIVGFGAVLDNLEQPARQPADWRHDCRGHRCVAGDLVVPVGRRHRSATRARGRRGAPGFFAACGTHFWRFARLGLVALLVYDVLFAGVHCMAVRRLYPRLTRNLTVERTAFLIRLGCYAVFGLLLVLCNLVFDYARIRIVVEDRRSAVGACCRSPIRAAQSRRALAVSAERTRLSLPRAALRLLAPGAPRSGVRMWLTLGLGELYIFLRHYLKLLFYASETAFFQGAVAHASYTAAPAVVWPESPAAEAVLNADSIAP